MPSVSSADEGALQNQIRIHGRVTRENSGDVGRWLSMSVFIDVAT